MEENLKNNIKRKIHTIRGMQVMFDTDLAELYNVDTGALNQAVKRNAKRFPNNFVFQLREKEYKNLISQSVISSLRWGGRRNLPYAFTEQGVAMLSGVLKSDTAIRISIQIMSAFEGQIFDSYKFVSDIIRTADTSFALIDNYIDDSVLTLFCKRKKNVQVTIFTKEISKQLALDLVKYNSQYPIID